MENKGLSKPIDILKRYLDDINNVCGCEQDEALRLYKLEFEYSIFFLDVMKDHRRMGELEKECNLIELNEAKEIIKGLKLENNRLEREVSKVQNQDNPIKKTKKLIRLEKNYRKLYHKLQYKNRLLKKYDLERDKQEKWLI